MTQAPHIRTGNINDISTLAEFQVQMAQATEKLKLDIETVKKGIRYLIEHPVEGEYLVACDEKGKALGSLLLLKEWSDWRNGHVIWIHSVWVVPEARKLGVFKAMFEWVENKVANDPGLLKIRLYVDQNNTRAQRVYENLGMTKDHYYLYEK